MAQEFEQVDQTELPYSLEAEQTILGSIFVDASVLSVVLERIKPCFRLSCKCLHLEKKLILSRF